MANFVGKNCQCSKFTSKNDVSTEVLFLRATDGECILQMGGQDTTIDINATNLVEFRVATEQPEFLQMQLVGLPTTEPALANYVWNDAGTLKIKTT